MMRTVLVTLFLVVSCASFGSAQQDDRADAMLDSFVGRQYFDLADHFLKRLADDPYVSDDWKSTIPFRRAEIIRQLASSGNATDVDQQLEEATELLKGYLDRNPDGEKALDARVQLAKLRLTQGRRQLREASTTEDEARKKKYSDLARTSFNATQRQFQALKNDLKAAIETMTQSIDSQADRIRLDSLRREHLAALLNVALIEYDAANLEKDFGDAAKYQKRIERAQKLFVELGDEYRDRLTGLEALYYQGRIYQDMGEFRTALQYFEELLQVPELPDAVSGKVLAGAITCLGDPSLNNPQRAVSLGEDWLRRRKEGRTTQIADVHVAVARAQIEIAKAESERKQQRTYDAAREHLMAAIRIPGPHQPTARGLLANLPAVSVAEMTNSTVTTTSSVAFGQAKSAADLAKEQLQSTQSLVDLHRRSLQTTRDAKRREEIETQLRDTEKNLAEQHDGALLLYERCLDAADSETGIDDLNQARYMVAYLKYKSGDYFSAAAIADFVSARYPTSPAAKDAASIAMAAYGKLYELASANDRSMETAGMIRTADRIVQRWPDDPNAKGALFNLVSLMINEGNVDKALTYLDRIAKESDGRRIAELQAGAALWRSWLVAKDQQPSSSPDDPRVTQSRRLLEAAIERSKDASADAVLVQAVLALAQIYHLDRQPKKSLELLNNKKFGPLALAQSDHEVMRGAGMAESAYRATLQAQFALLQDPNNSHAKIIQQAEQTMDSLEQLAGADADGRKRINAVYLALAKEMQQQLADANPQGRQGLILGLDQFLDRVASSAGDLATTNWVATTFIDLGEAMIDENSSAVPPEAQRLYERGIETYSTLLERPDSLSDAIVIQIRLKMARARRRLNQHKDAIDLLQLVLADKNNVISVQEEAAATYQEAGEFGSVNLYELAIRGARPDAQGNNVIWGWQRLAKVAASQMQRGPEQKAQFSDLFFKSRYNLALCRHLQANKVNGQQREDYRKRALQAIKVTGALYPDFGGPEWKQKFDQLAQRARGASS